jgi:hypothetical protein
MKELQRSDILVERKVTPKPRHLPQAEALKVKRFEKLGKFKG